MYKDFLVILFLLNKASSLWIDFLRRNKQFCNVLKLFFISLFHFIYFLVASLDAQTGIKKLLHIAPSYLHLLILIDKWKINKLEKNVNQILTDLPDLLYLLFFLFVSCQNNHPWWIKVMLRQIDYFIICHKILSAKQQIYK